MSEILGNKDVRDRLLGLAERGELHHCLLFEGPAGLGKAASARWLAKAINCDPPNSLLGPGPRPCGTCWSCRSIDSGQHPDVLFVGLDPERTAPIISVRQARALISKLALRPYRARRRMVIIDPADAMRAETANALLKTFEEPPRDTGFVLICESARRLLPTVRSRSQRVRFRPVANTELADWLHQQGVEDADWLAQMSDGCPGRALTLSEGEAATWRGIRDDLLQALQASISDRFAYADAMTKAKKGRAEWTPRVEAAIDALERLNRDALCKHAGRSDQSLYNRDQVAIVEEWSQRLQLSGCLRISQAIAQARRDMEAYVNGKLLLDALLARVVAELSAGPQTR